MKHHFHPHTEQSYKLEYIHRSCSPIKAVLFDLDDTLYNQSDPYAFAIETVLGKLPAPSDQLFYWSRQESNAIFRELSRGRRPSDELYIQRQRRTLARVGLDISDGCALEIQRCYEQASARAMKLSDDMKAALDLCQSYAQLGIVTNGRSEHQHAKFHVLKLERWIAPQKLFISEELGVAKPDTRMFSYATKALHCEPAYCLMVGDSLTNDIEPALAAGLQGLWYQRLRSGDASTHKACADVSSANANNNSFTDYNAHTKIDMSKIPTVHNDRELLTSLQSIFDAKY